jgi:PD-(D/E)XK endonuclease
MRVAIMRLTQRKGDIAVAKAVHTFMLMGYDVARPLTESAPYDLIVDTGSSLYRVQVRYWGEDKAVGLRRIHSNSKGYVVKKTVEGAYDWLYVLGADGQEYLLKECLHGRNCVTPKEAWRIKLPQPQEELSDSVQQPSLNS